MSRGQLLLVLVAGVLVGAVMFAMCRGLTPEPRRPEDRALDDESASEPAGAAGDEPAEAAASANADGEPGPARVGTRSLAGIVRSAVGDRLPGAEVEIAGFGRLRTLTDDEGEYDLARVPLASVTLVVRVPGYAEGRVELAPGEPDGVEQRDVTLTDGHDVAGLVVDPTGAPVAHARVSCRPPASAALAATTDRYGRFMLPEEAAGCEGAAELEGFAAAPSTWLEVGARNLLALRLAASVAGVVVSSTGQPLRQYALSLDGPRQAGSPSSGSRRHRQQIANASGRFTVSGLAAGTYELTVTTRQGTHTETLQLAEGQQLRELRLVVP